MNRARAQTIAVCAALALTGCGTDADGAPRTAARAFLGHLERGDAPGMCAVLTPRGVAELARDFGGSTCLQTTSAVARFVRTAPGQRRAVARARILESTDLPMSPAPYRADADATALRISFHDPILNRRQTFDVMLNRTGGRWRIDLGIAALFTIVQPTS